MWAILTPAAGEQLAQAGPIRLKGDSPVLRELVAVIDEFDINFNIVTPLTTRRPGDRALS